VREAEVACRWPGRVISRRLLFVDYWRGKFHEFWPTVLGDGQPFRNPEAVKESDSALNFVIDQAH